MKFCTKCGTKLDAEQKFCVSCGAAVETITTTNDLFGKMESNVQHTEVQSLSPEEIVAAEEQKRIEKERQEREFARAYLQKHNSMSDNYALGFIGALLGGLVGAIPWAIVSSMGWFVAWLGYVIAIAASKGYDLMKVKVSMKKMWFVAIAVIIGVFAGQIMSDMISIAVDSEFDGMFWYVFAYFAENFGEYLSINAANLFLGLVFAALGGFSVLKEIKKETAIINEMKARYPEETNI